MKRKIRLSIILLGTSLFLLCLFFLDADSSKLDELKEKHAYFLKNSPFKNTKNLAKKDRKSLGLPPNAYYERLWELTFDPNTGRPMPENIVEIRKTLKEKRKFLAKSPGQETNQWTDRGPNNIGGRTRGIMFDPNDSTNRRVFAGGVSGGLWVNQDITNPNSSWTLVPNIGANISVTSIIYDPNNTNVFYIGSGESYVSGNAVGRGVWKSTDGGTTWNNIFGGAEGRLSLNNQSVNGIFYVNDIVARDVGSTTELYAAIAGAFYGDSSNPNQFLGIQEQGLYRSTNGGSSWTRINLREANNTFINPNDIEIDLNNNIWVTTTRSSFGQNGGRIYRSTNGTIFNLIRTIPDAARTELEVSSTDPNKFWVAVNVPNNNAQQADLFFTDNAFSTLTPLNEPNDADNDISATDYTRGQAFYNLPIEVDQNDNLFIGGIDLFRSTNNGTSWTQISKWSNNNNLRNLNVPLVHADHHAIVFRPGAGNENQAVFGTDGGVYYTPNINQSQTSINITSRNTNYNVTQFYYGAIDEVDFSNGDDIFGGTQDNGTPGSINSLGGANSYQDFFGGDGGFTEIDDSGQYMIQSFPFNTHRWINYPQLTQAETISTSEDDDENNLGSFINTAVLDKNLDIFYSNASFETTFQIERVKGFLPGEVQSNDFLQSSLIDQEPTAFQVSPFTTTSTKLYVGLANGKVVRITNANTSPIFTDITNGIITGSISDIEFGETENDIFVTVHNYGVTSIWFTNNGGGSWRGIEGNLPDLPVKCILQDPLNRRELIIGTELGVWRTLDFTVTSPVWEQSFNGMSDVTVVDLDLRTSDNTVLASTHGRGMFTGKFESAVASVDEVLANNKSFTIFPTISDGNFTVYGNTALGKGEMGIYTISGKQVYRQNVDFELNEQKAISVNLSTGVYIVNIIDQNNRRSSEKIIIE